MSRHEAESEWRCRRCGALLGVERGGRLHLKYKTAQFMVRGSVIAVCRRCSELNETESPRTRQEEDARVHEHA